jgi:hypothetical protein
MGKALKAPMAADPTPMAADTSCNGHYGTADLSKGRPLSAAIGVGSAAIGASKEFRPHHSNTAQMISK